jgi:lactate racemase
MRVMQNYRLPYGKSSIDFELGLKPESGHCIELLAPQYQAPAADPLHEVEQAVSAAAFPPYRGGRCAIAINDHTRPVPHQHLLPPLLQKLERTGIPADRILMVIATGTHPPLPPERFREIMPEDLIGRYRVVCHNAAEETALKYLGETSRGTPVWIHREYAEAELRMVVGNLEPHQFVGFSGGAKSAAIGLAGPLTVKHNHSMMARPEAQIGRYEDNPCRQDIEEIGRLLGIQLALNAILGESKKIIRALAGRPDEVMAAGIPLVRQINEVTVAAPYDLMIVSPGGHPKDVNIYQAQKALAHAALVTRPGGIILIAAACPEGTGSDKYENWMLEQSMASHDAVVERFISEGYRIGPHKAFQISRDARRFRVVWHSEMEPGFIRRLLLEPAGDFVRRIHEAAASLPVRSRIGIMPAANATIPVLA